MGAMHRQNFTASLQRVLPGKMYVDTVDPKEEGNHSRTFTLNLRKKNKWWGKFVGETLPGCCGVFVASFVDVAAWAEKDRGIKRIGEILDIIESASKDAKFGGLLMTLQVKDGIVAKMITDRGYISAQFLNGKTNNDLILLFKNLDQKRPEPAKAEPHRLSGDGDYEYDDDEG